MLPDGEEFLWRPMLEGWVTYRDIKESRVDLADLDFMNDLLKVRLINDKRAAEAAQRRERQAGQPADLPLVGSLGDGFDAPMAPQESEFDAMMRWRR